MLRYAYCVNVDFLVLFSLFPLVKCLLINFFTGLLCRVNDEYFMVATPLGLATSMH